MPTKSNPPLCNRGSGVKPNGGGGIACGRWQQRTAPGRSPARPENPFSRDAPSDRIRVITERQLNRIVFLASETAAHLRAIGGATDVLAWLYSRQPAFEGLPAALACTDREQFLRAMFLRDAEATAGEPASARNIIKSEPDRPTVFTDLEPRVSRCGTQASLADLGLGKLALYTSTIVSERGDGTTHIFAAFLAVDEQDARSRIHAKVGPVLSSGALICRGFDPSEPIASSLLSEALSHCLADIERHPDSELAAGLDLLIEHSFAG